MNKSPSVRHYFDLWVLLSRTRDAVFKARQKELNQWNISIVQAAVLSSLYDADEKATPAKISRWIFREPQSVSEVLGRMESRGLLRKIKDLDKKNRVRVVLTEQGREMYHSKSSNAESIWNIMSCLSDEERQQMSSYLRKIQDAALKELGMNREERSS